MQRLVERPGGRPRHLVFGQRLRQLRHTVSAVDRELGAADQVALLLQRTRLIAACIAPLSVPAPLAVAVSIDTGPQALWWDIEDLLARLAMHCHISIGAEPMELRIHRLRVRPEEELRELRSTALDTATWQCWSNGRPLSFVQTLGWDGDDLLLRLMPLRQVQRWEDGEELAWQVKGFLARLRRQALIREPQAASPASV